MFRRLFAFLLCIVMITGMLPASVFAEEPVIPETGETEILPQETAAPTAATEEVPPATESAPTERESMPIESVITDDAMTSVADKPGAAFWASLDPAAETVLIPDGVTYIPDRAFRNFTNLKSVYIPASVTEIEILYAYYESPFYSCSSDVVIYCEAASRPSSWNQNWNNYSSGNTLTVNYGWSAADYSFWTNVDKSAAAIVIPEGVTMVPGNAFSGCTGLTEISFPKTLTSIGQWAFSDCSSLESIALPNGITKIDFHAFDGCSSLTSVVIPDGVTTIDADAFLNCASLRTVHIPASVTHIYQYAFDNCLALTDIYFGHTASDDLYIGHAAFDAYNSGYDYFPVTIHVPTVRDINDRIENYDWNYRNITWKHTGNFPVSTIALTEANHTTSIEAGLELNFAASLIPADTTSELVWSTSNGGIVKASDYRSGTATIIGTAPGAMTVRCESADDASIFAEYPVQILSPTAEVAAINVRSDTPFSNEVEIGTTAQMIADIYPGNAAKQEVIWSVKNGTGTAEIDENGLLTALTTGTVTVYARSTDGTDVTGSATVNIVRYVDELTLLFNGDPNKTTLGVGESVMVTLSHAPADATETDVTWTLTAGTGSIRQTSNASDYILICGKTAGTATLTATAKDSKKASVSIQLNVVGEQASYAVTGGNIYYNTVTGAIVDADDSVTVANIPTKINGTTITAIAPRAFRHNDWWGENTKLTSISIPNTVTYIGDEAFYNCSALASLHLGNGVTTIGKEAFYNCRSLVNLTIPGSVSTVAYGAFHALESLKHLTIPGELDLRNALEPYHTLESVTFTGSTIIAQPITVHNDDGFTWVETTHLPGRSAKQVVISDSVTTLEDYAFRDCSSIETLTIGDNVTTVGRHVFAGCYYLADVKLGNRMPEVGYCMFYNCPNLTTVTIPDSVTCLDTGAFTYCDKLTDVTLGSNVTKIMESVFYGCESLTHLNLPDSLTYIGEAAFYNCNNLQLFDLSAVPDTISQQNYTLTPDLVGIPNVFSRATGGTTSLRWNTREIAGETGYAWVDSYSDGRRCLYIRDPGTIQLYCYDEYTGAGASKTITCELGLEIEGIFFDHMIENQFLYLTAIRAGDNKEEAVTWSLRPEDLAYASLSSNYGTSTFLTAKSVDEPVQIQITAKSDDPDEAPETRTLWIRPAISKITITDAEGNIIDKTISLDLREANTIQFSATTSPEHAPKTVFWYGNDDNIAEVGYDGFVRAKHIGTVTVTAASSSDSRKTASIKLNVCYLDTATKFTAKTTAPTAGLVDGDTAQIQIFGSDKNKPLDPTAFTYTVEKGQENMASVAPDGTITAGRQSGTVTITAAVKNDPLGRSVTVQVKIIPAQTASILPIPAAEIPGQIVMVDAAGEITGDSAQAVKYRVYLDKTDAAFSFIVSPAATDTNGNDMYLTASSLNWASSDTRVAAVEANADGVTVTVPANTDGACVITATSTDLAKVEGVLEIFVRDYTPRLESSNLTVNSHLLAGVSTGLTPSYGNDIVAVELTDSAAPFTVTFADDLLTVTPNDVLKNGTYKLTVKVTCEEFGPFEFPLTVKVVNKLPSVTIKQSEKFNLFYSNSTADLLITVKDAVIRSAALEITDASTFRTKKFDAASGTMTVEYTPEYIAKPTGKPVSKVNVLVDLDGYRTPVSKTVSIAAVTAKPAVSLTPASSIINIAAKSEHSTVIRAFNKTSNTYVQINPADVTAPFAAVMTEGDGVKLTLIEAEGKPSKGGIAAIEVKGTYWMQPIKLTHKVTVQDKLPIVNLSAASLMLNRVFTKQPGTLDISLNQQNMIIDTIAVEPADRAEKLLRESAKISFTPVGNTLIAKLDKENLPENGNYSFRVIVTLSDGTKLTPKTFKVNVGSTVPTVKLKTTTLKLNKFLGTEHAAAWTEFVIGKGDGYEIAGFESRSNGEIAVEYRDGMAYARLLRLDAADKHTVSLTPILRHIATGEESPLPTALNLTVQVESKTPGVNVISSGKLDASLPDSAITYTVKSFTDVNGMPATVKLEGPHGNLFAAALDATGSSPVVTLKMRSDIKYDLKTAYKVDLVFPICGQQVRKSVSFKISQSNLKFAAVKTMNLYQFQSQTVTATITATAPTGAKIDQIILSSKSAPQFLRALGNGKMSVTPIGDGSSALVSFTVENPGYLTFGKSYNVLLDVIPVTTANSVKPTQIKLTVKSCK